MTIALSELVPEAAFRSREVALFIAQLDDQSRRLTEDTRGLPPATLAWQPAPGMNTIGMLLAHNAIVEVYWMCVAQERTQFDLEGVLGIGMDDDGMPLPEGAAPPRQLAAKDMGFYDDLLLRARRFLKEHSRGWSDSDLDRVITRRRRDGTQSRASIRWIYYHLLEHFAGHYGQILLLKHHAAAARGAE